MRSLQSASLCSLVLSLLAGWPGDVRASLVKPVMEVVEQIAKKAGKAPSQAAVEALESAFRLHGEAALEAARRGGFGLAEAAGRHGDDVYKLAREVPEAVPALAAHADTLVPLSRRFGRPVLEIATHAPGLVDDAARLYPSTKELSRLAILPPQQARQVIEFAHHGVDRRVPGLLLRETERTRGEILRWLDPKRIVALGLSVAMIEAAGGVREAVRSSPEASMRFGMNLLLPISFGVAFLAFFWIGQRFKLFRKRRA